MMLWQFGPPMSALRLQDIIKTVSIIICIGPTGLRLRHIGKTDPPCGTVQFCFRSGRLICSSRTGFRAVTTPLVVTLLVTTSAGVHGAVELSKQRSGSASPLPPRGVRLRPRRPLRVRRRGPARLSAVTGRPARRRSDPEYGRAAGGRCP